MGLPCGRGMGLPCGRGMIKLGPPAPVLAAHQAPTPRYAVCTLCYAGSVTAVFASWGTFTLTRTGTSPLQRPDLNPHRPPPIPA